MIRFTTLLAGMMTITTLLLVMVESMEPFRAAQIAACTATLKTFYCYIHHKIFDFLHIREEISEEFVEECR